jgi:hypothetical protein
MHDTRLEKKQTNLGKLIVKYPLSVKKRYGLTVVKFQLDFDA